MDPVGLSYIVCTEDLFGSLVVSDATCVAQTCRLGKRALQPLRAAIAFAQSRPQFHVDGPPLPLSTWRWIWDICARSVAEDGIDPSDWALAEHVHGEFEVTFSPKSRFLSSMMDVFQRLSPRSRDVIVVDRGIGEQSIKDLRISSVLMVDCKVETSCRHCSGSYSHRSVCRHCSGKNFHWLYSSNFRVEVAAVVFTADGRFGLIRALFNGGLCESYGMDFEREWEKIRISTGTLHLAAALPDALEAAGAKWAADPFSLIMPEFPDTDWDGEHEPPVFEFREAAPDVSGLRAILSQSWAHSGEVALKIFNIFANGAEFESEVTQEISHVEPPARVDPELAQLQADDAWACDVERCLHGCSQGSREEPEGELQLLGAQRHIEFESSSSAYTPASSLPQASEFGDNIVLLKFTRCGKPLRDALHRGPELEVVRAMAEQTGHSCLLRSGASIFVYPQQYEVILSQIDEQKLRPHHVIVSEPFLPLVISETSKLRSRENMRPQSLPCAIVSDADESVICTVERTFIDIPLLQLRSQDSVTQSESHAGRVTNPRRFLLPEVGPEPIRVKKGRNKIGTRTHLV